MTLKVKYRRIKLILGVILLTIILISVNNCEPKQPNGKIDETFLIEQRIDSTLNETKVTKEEIKVSKVKVKKAKERVKEAKQAKDTVEIIISQDSLINELEVEIAFYDTLSYQMDNIVTDQAEVIDIQKDSIIDLNKDVKDLTKSVKRQKAKTKIIAIVSSISLILILIFK